MLKTLCYFWWADQNKFLITSADWLYLFPDALFVSIGFLLNIGPPGKDEIFFGDSSLFMRGELQRDPVKTNINIRMVIAFESFPGDPVYKLDAF